MVARGAFSSSLIEIAEGRLPLPAAARACALAGIPVFPCEALGKRPITKHGFRDATADIGQVDRWWRRRPEANVGIPTGAASRVVVVDIDVHGQVDGFVSINRVTYAGLTEGWEMLVRTPSGGLHAVYPSCPGAVQRSWQAARAGVDFRGDGGYVVVPPSHVMVSGRRVPYRVESINPGPAHTLDSDVLRNLLDPHPTDHRVRARKSRGEPDLSRLASWVASRPEGERNRGLFWAACRLAENDVPPQVALDVLTAAASQVGLQAREITSTVQSAYRSVRGFPDRLGLPAQSRHDVGHRRSDGSVSSFPGQP